MFGYSVGFSGSANLTVQLSVTLSDSEPQFQGHSIIVYRQISCKLCMLRPNNWQLYQMPYASTMGILCLKTT